jgi:hypothetical protein
MKGSVIINELLEYLKFGYFDSYIGLEKRSILISSTFEFSKATLKGQHLSYVKDNFVYVSGDTSSICKVSGYLAESLLSK